MRCSTFSLLTSLLVSLFGFAPALVSAQQQDYTPVTAQRLLQPEPENWLMYRGTYDSWGYSPLDQITPEQWCHVRHLPRKSGFCL